MNLINNLQHKPNSVLKRASVPALSVTAGKKFIYQISVTGFYIHRIKPNLKGHPRRCNISILKLIEVFISQDRPTIRQFTLCLSIGFLLWHQSISIGAAPGNHRMSNPSRFAVPTRMSKLRYDYRFMLGPHAFSRNRSHPFNHCCKALFAFFIKPQLPRISSAFGNNRCRLSPYQACSASGESFISSQG